MNHNESNLQQQCVAWFRAQYPQYGMLLTHPINEGGRNTGVSGGIHKAEGTVRGVPDLLLFMPSSRVSLPFPLEERRAYGNYYGLGIELKVGQGKQSQSQKDFQHIFEAAGYYYDLVRSFKVFQCVINNWIANTDPDVRRLIASAHVDIERTTLEREREKLQRLVNKK